MKPSAYIRCGLPTGRLLAALAVLLLMTASLSAQTRLAPEPSAKSQTTSPRPGGVKGAARKQRVALASAPARRLRPAARTAMATAALSSATEQRLRLLGAVKSWGYQLRQIKFAEIAAAPHDLVVIDHALSAGRRFVQTFSAEQIQQAKWKPDGSRRLVLAYLSIGEAERHRFYWRQEWFEAAQKPSWLGEPNTLWDGTYLVHYWEPAWQQLIFGAPKAYLEQIKAAGFDGIYLDRADAHADWSKSRPSARKEMEAFIVALATAARANDPTFLVVMQNAEELVGSKPVLDAIDGVAKEDLFFGIDHKASANDPETVAWSLRQLRKAQKAGRKVLVVEYLSDPAKAAEARRRSEPEGFVLHVTGRDLEELGAVVPDRLDAGSQGPLPVQAISEPPR